MATNVINLVSQESFEDGISKLASAILVGNSKNADSLEIGTITFSGADTSGTLGGAFTGLTEAQLMTKYPFNCLKTKYVQGYQSDKSTLLSGTDLFLEMPNFYYNIATSSDGSVTISISGAKINSGYRKFVEDDSITQLNLGVYKSYRLDSYFRSLSGYLPTCNVNQATAIGQMPYYKTDAGAFRRAEYQDFRVRAAYDILCMFAKKTRQFQSIYRGIVDYTWKTDVPTTLGTSQYSGKSGACDSLGNGVVSGEVTTCVSSDDDSTTIDLTSGKRPFKLLGVENPYGLVLENLYGIVHNSGLVYTYNGIDALTSSNLTPSDTNTYYTSTGVQMPTSSSVYQKAVASADGYLVPISTGGGENSYCGDKYWYADGWRIFFASGSCYNASEAGLFYCSANDAWGYALGNRGFRLSFLS